VSSAAGPAHGVLFASGTYTTATSFQPAVQEVLTLTVGTASPVSAVEASGWSPTLFHDLHRLDTEQGTWETLVATLGQYDASRAEERLLRDAEFVSLHSALDDWQAPTFGAARAWWAGNTVHVEADVTDLSGVYAVLAVYNNGDGLWRSQRLTAGEGDTWLGSFAGGADTEIFFQAADQAGNVALLDDEGAYFQPAEGVAGLVAANDGPTRLGGATTLTATVTAGGNVTYTWSLGDGAFGSGPLVAHVYPTVGKYTAIVTASNPANWLTATTTVEIVPLHTYIYLPLVLRAAP
jgi:hypothetical protein